MARQKQYIALTTAAGGEGAFNFKEGDILAVGPQRVNEKVGHGAKTTVISQEDVKHLSSLRDVSIENPDDPKGERLPGPPRPAIAVYEEQAA